MDKLYLLVKEHFPEFVQADYPKFVAFVQAYYKWLEEQLPMDIAKVVDIDETPEEYLQYFIKQLDVYGLFTATDPYVLKYIKNIKEFYTAKGTECGLLFILKAVFNSDVTVDHPIKYVLRASDGRWVQETFITLRTEFGGFDRLAEWDFHYDCRCAGRNQQIPVTRTEILNAHTIRLYYQERYSISTFVGQRITIYDPRGELLYIGRIIPSPTRIAITNPGKDWQIGQLIVWPAEPRNTILKVDGIDANGGITRVQIVEYGYDHNEGETYIVSPYPVKPLEANFDLQQEQISFGDPPAYAYTLSIFDQIDGAVDNARGYAAGVKFGTYFLEDYQAEIYAGEFQFERRSIVPSVPTGLSPITLDDWLASRATLRYVFGPTASLKGRWDTEDGHISSETIRLQDSFYYQQFSYAIDSDVNPSVYRDLAKVISPAGTLMFTNYNLISVFKLDIQINITIPFITLDILDVTAAEDLIVKDIDKIRVDTTPILDLEFSRFIKNTNMSDSVDATDAVVKTPTKRSTDSAPAVDSRNKSIDKYRIDTTFTVESTVKLSEKSLESEAIADSPDTYSEDFYDYFTKDDEYYTVPSDRYTLSGSIIDFPETGE